MIQRYVELSPHSTAKLLASESCIHGTPAFGELIAEQLCQAKPLTELSALTNNYAFKQLKVLPQKKDNFKI